MFRFSRRLAAVVKTPLTPSLTPRAAPAVVPRAAPRGGHDPLAGVSEPYKRYHLAVAAAAPAGPRAHDRGVCFDSAGAVGPVSALSDEVVAAMPPPPRPDHPDRERELTRKIPASWGGGFLMALLAAYLFFKTRLKGGERCALESRAPWAARALERAGLVADLSPLRSGARPLDAGALADRIFARFSGGAAAMPAARALRLVRALGLLPEGDAAAGAALLAAATGGGGGSGPLTSPQFRALFASAVRGAPSVVVYLLCGERLGVYAAPPGVLATLGGLFDRLVAARPSGAAFSAAALSEVAAELGFAADEADAAAFLADCAAAAGAPSGAAPVRVSRGEFVDFMCAAAAHATGGVLDEAAVGDYVKVFTMLHLEGIREAAGVRPL